AGGRLVIDPDTTSATNIAPSNLLTVDVEGQVGATQYCDEDGLYCFLAADVAGGATPAPGADTEVLFNSGGILGADPSFVFYRSTGNLGLGVTDPEAQIHLSEQLLLGNINDCTAATQGALRLSVSGDVIEMCDFAGAGGYVAIGGASVAAPGSDRELIFNSGGLLAADANLSFTSSGVLQVVRNATTQAIDITGGIRITSDISNLADFQMNSNGLLAAESNMYFNIDSDNDVTTNAFIFGHNADTSAATELMRLQENGRLGLGVTTPQTRMDVDGTLKIAFGNEACDAAREGALHFNSSDNNFYVCQTNGNGWQRVITAGGGGGGLPAAGADRQIQFNSGNELAADANFVFTSAGNMGIGTNNPTSKLYIYENFAADGFQTSMSVDTDTVGSASAYRGVVGIQTTAINDATGAGFKEAYGMYSVGRAGNDASAQTAIGVASRVDVHAGDTGMIYSATDDGSSTGGSQYAMYINLDDADVNSYGIYQQSNNPNALFGTLGIGTQTPSSQLHLYRSGGNASALIEGDESSASDVTLLTSGDGASTVGDATATGWSLSARGNAFATATVQNDLMYYYWNGATYQQRFLLENDTGNLVLSDTDVVGDTKLDVDGTLKIAYGNEACDAAREGAIHFDSSDNNFYVCPSSGSWQRVITAGGGGTPAGGNDREIQFNSGSSLAGATNFVYTSAGDFIVGSYQIDDTGTGSEDSRMFFDVSNSAFRAGSTNTFADAFDAANSGQYSVAFGDSSRATGDYSFAAGFISLASGTGAVAHGFSVTASGEGAFAHGYNTSAIGDGAIAIGDRNEVFGAASAAIGSNVWVSGDNSWAIGSNTAGPEATVSGDSSFAAFLGNQGMVDVTVDNGYGFFGGRMVIDPRTPATTLAADTALEIAGTLKIAYGNEACDASRIGAIHFDSSSERFFVCQNAGEGWVNIATNNATAADPQRGIQFKSGDNLAASNNFVYTTDGDLIVGSYQIDDTGTGSEDSRMYFDVSNSAFRAGSVADARWDYTSAGQYSFATGDNTIASGASSFAAGGYTQATGYAATAFGSGANATGNYSFAAGDTSIAGGDYSTAFGSSDAMGIYSFAANTAAANGDYSVALGQSAEANGTGSIALGTYTSAGANSMAIGLDSTPSASPSSVSGSQSLGIFMGDQPNIDLSSANTMGLFGGRMVIDPRVAAAKLSADTALDIFGTLKIADGGESCSAAADGGMIRWNGASMQYCDGAAWQNFASGASASPGAPDRGIQFNSGGAFTAANNFIYTPEGDFIVGSYQIEDTTTGLEDNRMFFDVSAGAFRAGAATDGQWNFTSMGMYSFATGLSTTASGTGSTSMGVGSVASGTTSTAMGSSTTASGLSSTAMGAGAIASGQASTAMGSNTTASGQYSLATGTNTTASGSYSVTTGAYTTASGQASTAMGRYNSAGGMMSLAVGEEAYALSDYSVAFGLGDNTGVNENPSIVTGTNSFGIFMGAQDNVTFASASTMGLFGGRMVIDPRVPAAKLSADTALDVFGTLKIADGGESCSAAADGGMIRWNGATMQYCDGAAWQNFASGAVASPGAPDRGLQFNSGGSFAASNELVFTSAGNLGLGTATPTNFGVSTYSRVFHIKADGPNGDAELVLDAGDNSLGANPLLTFALDGTPVGYIQSQKSQTGVTDGGMTFHTHDGLGISEAMRLTPDGNLAVGLTYSSAKLNVGGTIKIADGGETCTIAADGGMVRWNGATMQYCDGAAWQNFASGAVASPGAPNRGIQFNSGGSFSADANFVYTSTGYLGLGVASPASRLHLDVPAPGLGTDIANLNVGTAGIRITEGPNEMLLDSNTLITQGSNMLFGVSGQHDIIFYTSASSQMRLTDQGRLGIGTDTPAVNLDLVSTANTVLSLTGDETSILAAGLAISPSRPVGDAWRNFRKPKWRQYGLDVLWCW
ncbi:MAG TPA: hypothetical protein EYQ41_08705, partial [Micavibrio sp.]|nr:hypothetical protein [Micavibrio sp.]